MNARDAVGTVDPVPTVSPASGSPASLTGPPAALAGSPSSTVPLATGPFADRLRWWRTRARLSQVDLAGVADVSSRHISFLETGRSRPSREMVLHLARHLDVPVRHRNELLTAAGFAPAYPDRPLDDAAMADLRRVVRLHLDNHEPFPAVCVDGHWNLLDANAAAGLFLTGVAPELLAPPVNVMRLSLHPDGIASRVNNFDPYAAHLVDQLRAQLARSADPTLAELVDEVTAYPAVVAALARRAETGASYPADGPTGRGPLLAMEVALDDVTLSLVTTIATLGAPRDVTSSELAIEAFYPADDVTEAWLRDAAG